VKVLDELRDLVEDAIKGSTVFEKSKVLTPDYIPKNLPHREKQIKELSINFREILSNPGSTSVRVVISGKTGTGKTVTTKKFGELFSEIAKEKGLRVVYTHINCHRQRTLYLMLVEIANQLNLQIPNRGLSSQETVNI